MEQSTISDEDEDEFPPKKRLEAPNYRLVEAGIATIPDMLISQFEQHLGE